MAFCDAARRIPSKFKVTMSGATNNSCSSCASFNTEFTLDQSGFGCVEFVATIAGSPCGFTQAAVVLTDSSGIFGVTFELRQSGTAVVVYSASAVNDLLAGSIVLGLNSGSADCNWPSTVTLVAVSSSLSELATAEYICPPSVPLVSPFLGNMPVPGKFPNTSGPTSISPEDKLL